MRRPPLLTAATYSVIPAQAGISGQEVTVGLNEIPASAGMTEWDRDNE
jgi:hypothetical protein